MSLKNLILFFLLLIWVVASGTFFIFRMNDNEIADFDDMLGAVARNNANSVELTLDKYTNFLKITAESFKDNNYNTEKIIDSVNDLVNMEDFSCIALVYPDGTSYLSNNGKMIPSTYKFTDKMKKREIYITDLYTDNHTGTNSISINVPVINKNGSLELYLVGILKSKTLSQIFDKIFYNVGGYFNLIDSDGQYLAASESELMLLMDISFIEALNTVDIVDGYDREDVRKAFTERKEGLVRYIVDDNERAGYYTPVNINNWVMFAVIPQDIIQERLEEDILTSVILVINLALVAFVLIAWTYKSQRDLKKFAETNEKNFRFVSEQTKKNILEWDFTNDTIKVTGKLHEVLSGNPNAFFHNRSMFRKYIFPEDLLASQQIIENLKKGHKASDIKLRILHSTGDYHWYIFSAVPIATESKSNIYDKAIGFLENIDEQEKEAALLRKMSELDSLTQIYNKGTTEALIANTIEKADPKKDQHSLIIIDLDNFKMLNDTFGHQYGDQVIKELADYLKTSFRHNDIVGRIGGDEFFVFMHDIKSEQLVIDKCTAIINFFNKSYEKDGKSVKISVSMGIAIYPVHADLFTSLYHHADIALYSAKTKGKNNFQFFDGNTNIDYKSQRTDIDSIKDRE